MSDLKPCYMDINGQRKKVDAYMDINGVRTKISSAKQQLSAPTISLDGDTLSITDTSGLATSFDILVDGVVKGSVEVEQEETYTIPAGTYVFNETIDGVPMTNGTPEYLNFSSNSENFTLIRQSLGTGSICYDDTWVYHFQTSEEMGITKGWVDESYRTITVATDQSVNAEFYQWFTTNTVKQEQIITFTMGGTTYQAKNGMTWAEWVDSSHNTGGFQTNSYNGVLSKNGTNIRLNGIDVNKTDTIIENANYVIAPMESG